MTAVSLSAVMVAAFVGAADRNVVLMIADDLGGELGCYGDVAAKTPNIDALAAQGTRFSHAFCTTASCSPSRSVMFTGLHNHANGQLGLAHAAHNFHQRPNTPTIFQMLKGGGFRTAIIGKKHVLPEEAYRVDFEPRVNPRDPVAMGKRAREFFATEGRFFAVVGFTDPHRVRSNFANDGKGAPKPPFFFDAKDMKPRSYLPDVEEVRADWADYYAAVSRLDQGVGEVMTALKESGKDQETLVIFLSDNGPPFPGAKCGLYEPGVHLPLIVRNPIGKPVAQSSMMTTWCDMVPTILEWTGVRPAKLNAGFHGRSVLDSGKGVPKDDDHVFLSHTFHEITMFYPMRAVRTRTHKLIWNLAHELPFPIAQDQRDSPSWKFVEQTKPATLGKRSFSAFAKRPEFELYDLGSDPDEVKNLAGEPSAKAAFDDLLAKLKRFQKETKDPFAGGISRTME